MSMLGMLNWGSLDIPSTNIKLAATFKIWGYRVCRQKFWINLIWIILLGVNLWVKMRSLKKFGVGGIERILQTKSWFNPPFIVCWVKKKSGRLKRKHHRGRKDKTEQKNVVFQRPKKDVSSERCLLAA